MNTINNEINKTNKNLLEKKGKKDKVQLSITVDDNKIVTLTIFIDENVDIFCDEFCKTNKIENAMIKNALKREINTNIERILKEKRDKEQKMIENKEQSIKKLYYDAMEKLERKKLLIEKQNEEKFSKFIENCTFTPKINPTKNILYKRDYDNIGEKLYNDAKHSQEKIYLIKINEAVKNREFELLKSAPNIKPLKKQNSKNNVLFKKVNDQNKDLNIYNQNTQASANNCFDTLNTVNTCNTEGNEIIGNVINTTSSITNIIKPDNVEKADKSDKPNKEKEKSEEKVQQPENIFNSFSHEKETTKESVRKLPRHNTISLKNNLFTKTSFKDNDAVGITSNNKLLTDYIDNIHKKDNPTANVNISQNMTHNNLTNTNNINNISPNVTDNAISPNRQEVKKDNLSPVPPNLVKFNSTRTEESIYKRRYSATLTTKDVVKPQVSSKEAVKNNTSTFYKEKTIMENKEEISEKESVKDIEQEEVEPIPQGRINMKDFEIFNKSLNLNQNNKTTSNNNNVRYETHNNPNNFKNNLLKAVKTLTQSENNNQKTKKLFDDKHSKNQQIKNNKNEVKTTTNHIKSNTTNDLKDLKNKPNLRKDLERRIKIKHDKLYEAVKKEIPFKPNVSEKSTQLANKHIDYNNSDIFTRLFQEGKTKRSKSNYHGKLDTTATNPRVNSLSYINVSLNQSGNKSFNFSNTKINNSIDTNKTLTGGRLSSKTKIRSVPSINTILSPKSHDDRSKIYKKNIREMKSDCELKEFIDDVFRTNEENKKQFGRKIVENIDKFKLNNLKEIFEIIYNNCTQMEDLDNIENFGISSYGKSKLILPTCFIIKERELEFNFQNFYLISNEIFNYAI